MVRFGIQNYNPVAVIQNKYTEFDSSSVNIKIHKNGYVKQILLNFVLLKFLGLDLFFLSVDCTRGVVFEALKYLQ